MICKINEIKNSCLIIILVMFWLPFGYVKAQDSNLNNQEKTKADEILLSARKAIGIGKEKLNLQKISLIYDVSTSSSLFIKERKEKRQSQASGERELHSLLPNNFRYLESLKMEDTVWITKFTLNGNLMDADKYGMWEGKRTEIQTKGQENPSEERKKQEIREKKEEVFFFLFPILLESSDLIPLAFNYVGKAELNSEKADVIETRLNEETKIRLFFDEASHLLKLLTTESILQNGSNFEEKRFYSDYKTVEGLMIANRINVETKLTSNRLDSQTIEEQTLKSVKINPTFKSNFFEVKKK